jgi:hypothetical protein
MKLYITILFFLACGLTTLAQSDSSFQHIKNIYGDIVDFAVDNLDNIYLLNSKNQLKKLNGNGDSVAIYNDVKHYGKATLIDVSNPLKVLLYYKNFGTVVMLDRFLNFKNAIDLRSQNILQAKAISQSYDNKIWVYDELENKLKKIDEDGKLLLETSDFRLLFDETVSAQSITDADLNVYLYDSSKAVYVFDYYGALKNKILINGWKNFKVSGKYIFGSVADTLYRYEIENHRYDQWKMPVQIKNSNAFSFSTSRLYALKKDRLEIFLFR